MNTTGIAARALFALWWAYKRDGHLRLLDLHVYFACHAAAARRAPAASPARYTFDELRALVGRRRSRKQVAQSLLRLQAAGLLRWSETRVGSSPTI